MKKRNVQEFVDSVDDLYMPDNTPAAQRDIPSRLRSATDTDAFRSDSGGVCCVGKAITESVISRFRTTGKAPDTQF